MKARRRESSAPLAVQPVDTYRVPRYPSHEDPNPLLVPERISYPVCREVAAALAVIGALGIIGGSTAGAAPSGDGTDNPFTAENLAPIHWKPQPMNSFIAFGVGSPSRPRKTELTPTEAKQAIESVFRSEGFALIHGHRLKENGVEAQLEAFDPEHHVGYAYYRGETSAEDLRAMAAGNGNFYERESLAYALGVALDETKTTDPVEVSPKFAAAIERCVAERTPNELSVEEAQLLEREAAQRKTFVMVVAPNNSFLRLHPEKFPLSTAERLQIDSLPNGRARYELEDAITEQKDAQATKVALEELERAVRGYIRWARSQGLQ